MSSQKATLVIAICSLTINVLAALPGCYLSFVAWLTKFSGNTTIETYIARSAIFASVLGIVFSILAIANSTTTFEKQPSIQSLSLLAGSAAGILPLSTYIMLKLT